MSASKPMRYVVAGIAAVALAFGAYAIGNSNSSSGTSAANAGRPIAGQAPGNGQLPRRGPLGNGQAPPGFGTDVTGAAADRAAAAATAKYKGNVERVMKLADGSYEVHVLTSNGGEYHVAVSKGFKVTGANQGGPGAGAAGRGAPPSGTAPQSGSSGSSGSTN